MDTNNAKDTQPLDTTFKLFQQIDQQYGQQKKNDALKRFLGTTAQDQSNDQKRQQFREVGKILGDSKILQVINAAIIKEPRQSSSTEPSGTGPSHRPDKQILQAAKQATTIEEANDRKNKIVNYLFRIRRPAGASLSRLAQFKHDYDTPWKHAGQNNNSSSNDNTQKNRIHQTDGSYSPQASPDSIDIATQMAQRMKRSTTNWNALSARGNILSSAEGLLKADIDRGMSQGFSSIETQYKYTLEQADQAFSVEPGKKELQLKYLLKKADKTDGGRGDREEGWRCDEKIKQMQKKSLNDGRTSNDKSNTISICSGKPTAKTGTASVILLHDKSQKNSKDKNSSSILSMMVNDRYASINEQEQLLRDVLIRQKHKEFKKIKENQKNNNNNNHSNNNLTYNSKTLRQQQSSKIENRCRHSADTMKIVLSKILNQQTVECNINSNNKANDAEGVIQPCHQRSISCNSNVNTTVNNTNTFSITNTMNSPQPTRFNNITVINRNRLLNRSANCYTSISEQRNTLDTSTQNNSTISPPRGLLLNQNAETYPVKKFKNLKREESKEAQQQQQSAGCGRLNSTDRLSSTLKQLKQQSLQQSDIGQSSQQGIYVQPFVIKQEEQQQPQQQLLKRQANTANVPITAAPPAAQNSLAFLNTSNIAILPFSRIQDDLIIKHKNGSTNNNNNNSQSDSKVNYVNNNISTAKKQQQYQYKYSEQAQSRQNYYCYTDCSDSARLSTLDTEIHLNSNNREGTSRRFLKSCSSSSVPQFESIQFLEKQQEQLVKDIDSIKQVQEHQQYEQEHLQSIQQKELEQKQQQQQQQQQQRGRLHRYDNSSGSSSSMKHWSSACETERIKEVSKFIRSSQEQLRNIMACCSARTPKETTNVPLLKHSASSASSVSNDSMNKQGEQVQKESEETQKEVADNRRARRVKTESSSNDNSSEMYDQSQKQHSIQQLKQQIQQIQWNSHSESRCMRTSQLRRKLNKERQRARLFILSQERDIDAYAHMPPTQAVNMIVQ